MYRMIVKIQSNFCLYRIRGYAEHSRKNKTRLIDYFSLAQGFICILPRYRANNFKTFTKKQKKIRSPQVTVIDVRYVARTLLSWSRVMSDTRPTCMSDMHALCIIKEFVMCHHVMSIFMWPCPCNIR